MTPIKIIVADDNVNIRKSLIDFISINPRYHFIGECSNGQEAIDLVEKQKPDVVFMDISMRPVNGFEATRKIIKLVPLVKIIVFTFHNSPDFAKNILNAGAVAYVTKSSEMEELNLALEEVLKGSIYICKELHNNGFI